MTGINNSQRGDGVSPVTTATTPMTNNDGNIDNVSVNVNVNASEPIAKKVWFNCQSNRLGAATDIGGNQHPLVAGRPF
tara:strand:- start:238 stop:471 length:234 start_codon:yes stop_codon:yes gene_type:complete